MGEASHPIKMRGNCPPPHFSEIHVLFPGFFWARSLSEAHPSKNIAFAVTDKGTT